MTGAESPLSFKSSFEPGLYHVLAALDLADDSPNASASHRALEVHEDAVRATVEGAALRRLADRRERWTWKLRATMPCS